MTGKEVSEYSAFRRYAEIVRRLTIEGNTDKTDGIRQQEIYHRSLAHAYLRMGENAQAIRHLQSVISMSKVQIANDYCEYGAAYWLCGQTDLAVERWEEGSRCEYGDAAGNITPWLLMHYASGRLGSEEIRQRAVVQISQRLNTGWANNWPAALARYVIDAEYEDRVEKAIQQEHPVRQPDERCRFDFYRGVRCLEADDVEAASTCFKSAVEQPRQKTWSTEFVLANYEANNN